MPSKEEFGALKHNLQGAIWVTGTHHKVLVAPRIKIKLFRDGKPPQKWQSSRYQEHPQQHVSSSAEEEADEGKP